MKTYVRNNGEVVNPRLAENRGGLSSAEVCRRTGLTYRQLCWMIRRGYVRPSVSIGAGTGDPHVWAERDVDALRVFADLIRFGFRNEVIGEFSLDLRRRLRDRLAEFFSPTPAPWGDE